MFCIRLICKVQGVQVRPRYGRLQGGGGPPPPEMSKSVFAANVVKNRSRRSMHHFEKMSSVSEGLIAHRPPSWSCPWTLLGDFGPSNPLIAHPWKNSSDAHDPRTKLKKLTNYFGSGLNLGVGAGAVWRICSDYLRRL